MEPSGLPTIYVDGPEDFLEHGSIVFQELDGKEPKSSLLSKFNKEGIATIKGKNKQPFLWPIFEKVAENTSFYLAYKMRHDVRLLADRAGEAIFLEGLTADDRLTTTTKSLGLLTHALPVLADMPIESLLRIREEERESFEAYRFSITEISNKALTGGMTEAEALEYFGSELAPRLEKMRREISLERKRQKTRTTVGLASIAAGVAIGAFAGLPTIASVPIAALGATVGGKLLMKAAESKCEHGSDMRQNDDLFFLLRLVEEGEQRPMS